MIEKNCGVCGVAFKVHACGLKRGQGKYCSYKCAGVAKKGANNPMHVEKVQRQCKQCQAQFFVRPKELNYGGKVFCSMSCQELHWAEIKSNKPQFHCKQCGDLITGGGKVFCSKKCEGRWSSANTSTKVKKNCRVCQAEYFVIPAVDRYGHGVYCSQRCLGVDRSRKAIQGHSYRGRGGRRNDLGDIYFRSSWEANWARYLNLMINEGIVQSWQFEPDTFSIDFLGSQTSYTPDFKVFYSNGEHEYLEIKGFLTIESKNKLALMPILYPDVKLRVVYPSEYYSIKKKYAHLIPEWEVKVGERRAAPLYVNCLKCGNLTSSKYAVCSSCPRSKKDGTRG